jgi:hypothetical protein
MQASLTLGTPSAAERAEGLLFDERNKDLVVVIGVTAGNVETTLCFG